MIGDMIAKARKEKNMNNNSITKYKKYEYYIRHINIKYRYF